MLEVSALRKTFGGFVAVSDVSFTVETRQIAAVIGPNGAGKSTLFNLITGHLPPDSGTVVLDGNDITGVLPHKICGLGLGRSFQRTNIFPELTVEQQLRVASWAISSATTGADIAEVMAEFNLGRLAHMPAGEISYGDQRRLDLSLALVGRPAVLLLDEPAAGLTVEESLDLARILRALVNRWNVTVLLAEHDMQVVFSTCDRISVLHLGTLLSEGSCAEVRADPTVIAAYLGTEA